MIRIVIHVARYIPRCGNYLVLVLLILTAAEDVFGQPATEKRETEKPVGVQGKIGCRANPTRVKRLLITKPGLYENYLVDSEWEGGNRVKVTADNVTIRNCEIRNATGNGIGVFRKNTVIENCRIHHLLN